MGILKRWIAQAAERRFLDRYTKRVEAAWNTRDDKPVTPGLAVIMHRQAMTATASEVLPRRHKTLMEQQTTDQFKDLMEMRCGLWLAALLDWHPVLLLEALMISSETQDLHQSAGTLAAHEYRSRYLRPLDDLVSRGKIAEATELARQRHRERFDAVGESTVLTVDGDQSIHVFVAVARHEDGHVVVEIPELDLRIQAHRRGDVEQAARSIIANYLKGVGANSNVFGVKVDHE